MKLCPFRKHLIALLLDYDFIACRRHIREFKITVACCYRLTFHSSDTPQLDDDTCERGARRCADLSFDHSVLCASAFCNSHEQKHRAAKLEEYPFTHCRLAEISHSQRRTGHAALFK